LKTYHLTAELWVPRPIEVVFPFFSNAENLNEITPGWLNFQLLTSVPIQMMLGTIMDYKLRLHGIPIRWQSQIEEWDPPFRFVDSQIRGPYRKWIHTHTFQSRDGGTVIRDDVEYAIGLGWLDEIVKRWLVKPDLDKIFEFRHKQLAHRYGLLSKA
jgi:ligand-binding SRPBCC domain-containing protein